MPPPPPEAVVELLRHLGVSLTRAGDATQRVTRILEDVARVYAARGVTFFVVPTGVFVRIRTGGTSRMDFQAGASAPLRLDQIDALYRLVDDIRHGLVDAEPARARLGRLLQAEPRFGRVVSILASGILTLGLGLVLNPTAAALPAFLSIGFLVGALRWWADRNPVLSLVLPVAAAALVTALVFRWLAPALDSPPLEIVIPTLITFLPGAALTVATVELSTGDIVAGSARLVDGLQRLLVLSFGIALGVEVGGLPTPPSVPGAALGPWAAWVGVLVFGVGQFFASSAPPGTLPWLLLVLYVGYGIQATSGLVLGPLGASFLAAALVLPVCYAIQSRRSGPPVPVTFLPTFWLLVPGSLGLQGVAQMVGADQVAGLGDFLDALLTIVAIAVGVVVGSGLSERIGRVTSTWRGL
ncbi:threonine/serine ThrE exporter family protein [Intrasporangium flavum]|uniref:threonine/serine ThrE exporter family protein n=1 Tax=Intrasporangium flavum TaxID=1428657 RepID=UPI001F608C54|nr:threonine/serine exporter family protein [Intrasporangium flavum]